MKTTYENYKQSLHKRLLLLELIAVRHELHDRLGHWVGVVHHGVQGGQVGQLADDGLHGPRALCAKVLAALRAALEGRQQVHDACVSHCLGVVGRVAADLRGG
eukprot:scaffold9096_cov25-Prasinocladus_malaysianus.AAC.2